LLKIGSIGATSPLLNSGTAVIPGRVMESVVTFAAFFGNHGKSVPGPLCQSAITPRSQTVNTCLTIRASRMDDQALSKG